MPRTKPPPTPASSTGPAPQDKQSGMENAFILPPAAMNQSPPSSPIVQRKRTLSGSAKSKEDLPPPPSRARKIIQMKPKEDCKPSTTPATGKTTSPKRKQPTASSAAGRKIARKTAHSIIERRRRSKMNEEFGVLKDMIPACKGVEMHKLAILQAGIEYVRYLQGCVEKLQSGHVFPSDFQTKSDEQMIDDEVDVETPSASPQPEPLRYRRDSVTTNSTSTAGESTHPSPALRPNISSSSLSSQRQLPPLTSKTYSTSPPPISVQTPLASGVSPAFTAMHFSPDLSRTISNQNQHLNKHSPHILPLPQAAMSMHSASTHGGRPVIEGHAEATATAALMMMTTDRRASTTGRVGGMSVKDLLSN